MEWTAGLADDTWSVLLCEDKSCCLADTGPDVNGGAQDGTVPGGLSGDLGLPLKDVRGS